MTVHATSSGTCAVESRTAPDLEQLRSWLAELATHEGELSDAERIDRLRVLEELKAGAAAEQARLTADFHASQRSTQAAAGVSADQQGRGVASQIGLARRESPFRGSRHVGFARALVEEMPHLLGLLTRGLLSEWRATLIVRETACLKREDRSVVDQALCADPTTLAGMGDKQIIEAVKKLAYKLDPASVVRRIRRAESERRVSIRPAPDTMTYLTGLLPVAQGVAVHASLKKAADSLIAAGDGRSRGQIMADRLVELVTGRTTASKAPVMVNLVITDKSLFGHDQDPGHLPGYGPVPAWWARRMAAQRETQPGQETQTVDDETQRAVSEEAEVWLRRLYSDPKTGELVAMESRAKTFPPALRELIDLRDLGTCRTPWCDAPIRHTDHAESLDEGGPTTSGNGQGLCEQCNYAKEAPGWRARPSPGVRHTVVTITPTGHTYTSEAPRMPGSPAQDSGPPRGPAMGRLEIYFKDLVLAS